MREEVLFKSYQQVDKKLLEYGFKKDKENFFNEIPIMNQKFLLRICIGNDILIDVIDLMTNELYMPFYVKDSTGSFVGDIRKEVEKILLDMREKCFVKKVFQSDLAYQIIAYIDKKYHDQPEYLWEDFPNNAVFRNSKNQKWYCAILTAKKRSLGLNEEGETEVVDLKGDPKIIEKMVDYKHFFPAYHMNKKHWFTIILNSEVPLEEICQYIDAAYLIVDKK